LALAIITLVRAAVWIAWWNANVDGEAFVAVALGSGAWKGLEWAVAKSTGILIPAGAVGEAQFGRSRAVRDARHRERDIREEIYLLDYVTTFVSIEILPRRTWSGGKAGHGARSGYGRIIVRVTVLSIPNSNVVAFRSR
jgi:hypothetical protein